ncbi:MAG: hypothetical protein AAF799_07460 [Myxococcota bacterium]
MPANDRTLERIPPEVLESLARAASRKPELFRRISDALPRVIETLAESDLPIFEEGTRPQAESNGASTDTSGKGWVSILHWVEQAEASARFTKGAVTMDFEPALGLGEPLPLTDEEIEARLALSTGRTRTMTVWWRREDDGRYRLTLSYEFPDDVEREFIRGAIMNDPSTQIEFRWTHEARYLPENTERSDADRTSRPTIDSRVGAASSTNALRVSRTRDSLRELSTSDLASRIQPTVSTNSTSTSTSTAEPTHYSFTQTASKPLVYPLADHPFWQDGPSTWRLAQLGEGRVTYYRFTGYESTYEHLPTDFRMSFDEASASPALEPYVHEDEAGNPLVDITVSVSPHVDSERREALRQVIQAQENEDFAILVSPAVTGTLQLDVGLKGAESPTDKTVGLDASFGLAFSFGSEHWAPNMETLSAAGGGAHGRVFVDILEDNEGMDASVPVALRLEHLHADDVIAVEPSEEATEGVPRRFVLRNRIDRAVTLSPVTIHLADQVGDAGVPTNVRSGKPVDALPSRLEPQQAVEFEVAPVDGANEWNAVYVELGEVEVEAPEDGWLAAIHHKASSSRTTRRVTVRATNLAADAAAVAEYDSTHVELEATSADPPSGRLERGTQEWTSKLSLALTDLWDLSLDPTRDAPYVLEWRSEYSDLTGLPQRTTNSSFTTSIRALLSERPDSTYDLLDAQGQPLAEGLDRAATEQKIEERRAAGQTWTLRVVSTATLEVPGNTATLHVPEPTDTVTSTPPEQPAAPTQSWSVYIQPFGVDFAADVKVATVHITYTHADGRIETSGPINLHEGGPVPTNDSFEWKVGLHEGDPRRFDYTVDYLGHDGRKDHAAFEGVTEPLIWLERPAAPTE